MITSEALYKKFQALPEEKAAQAMSYIKTLEMAEPPLNDDEKEGLRVANMELAAGEGRSFKEAIKDLW
jgi:hypothetical protein